MMSQQWIGRVKSRARQLKEGRPNWIIFWEECATYFYPERRGFIAQLPPGTELNELIWTSSPIMDSERFSDILDEWCCPHGQFWIGLEPEDEQLKNIPEVRVWCEAASKVMHAVIYNPATMFKQRSGEYRRDLVTFGTAIMMVYYDAKGKHLVFKVPHLRDFCFSEGGRQQPVDSYGYFEWDLQQIVDEFGLDALPKALQDQWNSDAGRPAPQQAGGQYGSGKYMVLHAVIPRFLAEQLNIPGDLGLHPYVSLWILENYEAELRRDGFWENPYTIARWRTVTHEPYGRGPCMVALADARTANAVAQALVEITEKQGNPPVMYPADMIRGEIELFPGGATPFDPTGYQWQGDPIKPIKLGTDAPLTDKYLEALEIRIGKQLYKDLWDQTAQHEETQEEAQARQMTSMTASAPLLGRVQEQSNDPILDRVFQICMRLNAFPPLPPQLNGKKLKYNYDATPIGRMRAIAEVMSELKAIETTSQVPALQAATSENLDADLTVRDTWRAMGLKELKIKPLDVVLKLRDQNAKAQQAQQAAQTLGAAAPAAKAAGDLAQSGALNRFLPPPQPQAPGQG